MKRNSVRRVLLWLVLAGCALLFYGAYYLYPPVIWAGTGRGKVVALTIDDGPDPRYSRQVLDVLRKYRVRATFFVIGSQVEKYPDIVREELRLGHELGNHTFSHDNLDGLDAARIGQEIKTTNGIIYKYTGKNVYWFRPPRKRYNLTVVDTAGDYGLETILWSTAVETGKTGDPQEMACRVVERARPGFIVLLHDGRLDRGRTVKALPLIIEGLKQKGYTFATLSELLADRGG